MNVALLLLISIPTLIIAYFVYTNYISRAMGLEPLRKAPSIEMADERDYVPTKRTILFAHHFASMRASLWG